MASINQTTNQLPNGAGVELNKLLHAMLADITALQSAVNTLVTKLNADGGVTDVDYAPAPALTTKA